MQFMKFSFFKKFIYAGVLSSLSLLIFDFFIFDSLSASKKKISKVECMPIFKRCVPYFDKETGLMNPGDKTCETKGKECISNYSIGKPNCEKVLRECFDSSCSGSSCSDINVNKEMGYACLLSSGSQYIYSCYDVVPNIAVSYANQASANAEAAAQQQAQLEAQTAQAQAQAEAAAAQAQAQAQEAAAQAQAQAQAEAARIQAEADLKMEQMRIEQEEKARIEASRTPETDMVERLNALKKNLNQIGTMIDDAKNVIGYQKVDFGQNDDVANKSGLMWFRPDKAVKEPRDPRNGTLYYDYYTNEDKDKKYSLGLDSDVVEYNPGPSIAQGPNLDGSAGVKINAPFNEKGSKYYYTCSVNAKVSEVRVALSNYYDLAKTFMSEFEDTILIAMKSPNLMANIDFGCMDDISPYVQPLKMYIDSLTENDTALCKFDSSSMMNALSGVGGGLPSPDEIKAGSSLPRLGTSDSSSGGLGRLPTGNTLSAMNSLFADTNIDGGTYNTNLISFDSDASAMSGAKVVRAVGYASDVHRALTLCYGNTLSAVARVIGNNINNTSSNVITSVNNMNSAYGLINQISNNMNQTTLRSYVSQVCSVLNNQSLTTGNVNVKNVYEQSDDCEICRNDATMNGMAISDIKIKLNNCYSYIQEAKNNNSSGGGGNRN